MCEVQRAPVGSLDPGDSTRPGGQGVHLNAQSSRLNSLDPEITECVTAETSSENSHSPEAVTPKSVSPEVTSSQAILWEMMPAEVYKPEQPKAEVSKPEVTVADSTAPASNTPMLPPCRICGEKASGFHYGANTCEACKGFFRRCLNRKEQYKCVASGQCEITPAKRSVCSHCRWRKCIDAGMSKTAIKTGRYTHEKKSRDIREVKRLQHVQKLKAEGKYSEELVDENDTEELDRIIKHITDVHMQHTPHTPEFFAKLPQKEKEFLEQRELQQKMFGTLRPIPREEYMQIYQSTGIDVDGRREMIKHMIPCIEKSIKRFIAFAKSLPGFKELPIDDQIALIKASRTSVWNIWYHRSFDFENEIAYLPNGTVVDGNSALQYMPDPSLLRNKIENAKLMQRLDLSIEETIILSSLAIICPDAVSDSVREQMDELQWKLTRALCLLIQRNHKIPHKVFAHCIRVLTQERSIASEMKEHEKKVFIEWSDTLDFPPLLHEILGVKR